MLGRSQRPETAPGVPIKGVEYSAEAVHILEYERKTDWIKLKGMRVIAIQGQRK